MVIAWLCYDMKYNLISLLIDISCSDITTCKVQRNHFQWHFINWSRRTLHGDEGPSHIQNIDESAILPFYWKLRYHNYSLSHSIDSSSVRSILNPSSPTHRTLWENYIKTWCYYDHNFPKNWGNMKWKSSIPIIISWNLSLYI